MSFKKLQAYEVKGRKAFYTLPVLGDPQLECIHAGRSNAPYTNAISKSNAGNGNARKIAQGQITAKVLSETLDIDRQLFSKYVVTGWSGVVDDKGETVEFSPEVCLEYLSALPDWIMSGFSSWAAAPVNFLPEDMPTEEEIKEQAGN